MKLAEALILRSDLQIRMTQLRERLLRSSKRQEGMTTPEEPNALLEELNRVCEELTELIQRINTTNCTSQVDGKSISDWLVSRDILLQKRKILEGLIDSAASLVTRYSRTEIRIESAVDVDVLQKESDELSKIIREVDTRIQQANWLIELI